MLLFQDMLNNDVEESEYCSLVRQALDTLLALYEDMSCNEDRVSRVSRSPLLYTGMVGRPQFIIPIEQLKFLIDSQFTVPQMANIIGVSVRTIHRRLSDYGISVRDKYTTLTNAELDEYISRLHSEFPLCGNKQIAGHLISLGFHVQQHRIRESMRRVDPLARRLTTIHRRSYKVPSPLSLWHLDGNHKLIRYL